MPKLSPPGKRINPVDRHVGQQIRIHRINAGLTQEKLGDALGITFQQIQKYEKGTNRVSGSRLAQIRDVLRVTSVDVFFQGAPPTSSKGDAKPLPALDVIDMMATREGQKFAAMWKVMNTEQRHTLVVVASYMTAALCE